MAHPCEVINFKAQDGTSKAMLDCTNQSKANAKMAIILYMVLAIYKMLIIIEYVSREYMFTIY
jgi:hypothetical protein